MWVVLYLIVCYVGMIFVMRIMPQGESDFNDSMIVAIIWLSSPIMFPAFLMIGLLVVLGKFITSLVRR